MGLRSSRCFEGCDRRVKLPQGNSRLSQIMERDIPIERIKPHAGIDHVDRRRRRPRFMVRTRANDQMSAG